MNEKKFIDFKIIDKFLNKNFHYFKREFQKVIKVLKNTYCKESLELNQFYKFIHV